MDAVLVDYWPRSSLSFAKGMNAVIHAATVSVFFVVVVPPFCRLALLPNCLRPLHLVPTDGPNADESVRRCSTFFFSGGRAHLLQPERRRHLRGHEALVGTVTPAS